ncbi:MAG TPA: cytochrome bc complex cytochrome b subunit [Firmicutes bacterium]|nr:cytochrome bc complex cytochrome b subunit [Bacillota bacterium]
MAGKSTTTAAPEKPRNALADWLWSWSPRSTREAGDSIVTNFLLHWFPAKVSRRSLATGYSFWLGTISAFLFLYLTVTGVVLMVHYIPSVERAYASIKDLEYVVSYGEFLRATHRIAAHLMVAVVFLHMVRVFLTGAYKNGVMVRQLRPLNWWIGIVMLVLTLVLSFTGYLLPWDQLAYWAVTVGTNIASAAPLVGDELRFFLLGGNEIGQNTLIRFYVLHCMFLPLVLFGLFLWHMWRIRKDGGLACDDRLALEQHAENVTPAKSKTYSLLGITAGSTARVEASLVDEEKHQVNSVPAMLLRIGIVGLLTLAVTAVLALWLGSPLEEPANPELTPNPAKAPWYFLWLQELVTITTFRIGSYTVNGAFIGGVLVPGLLLLFGFAQPFIDRSSSRATGVWFHRERRLHNILFIAITVAVLVLLVIGTYLRGPYWEFYWPWEAWPEHAPQV